jgi:hypothetical protein
VSDQTFSEEDLQPSDDDKRRARLGVVDRAAASVAVLAAGLVAGGMLALGACAAPSVFRTVPDPLSGMAMGSAFARFDRVAIAASCVALFAEVVRTYLVRRERPRVVARIRRFAGIGLAAVTTFIGMRISPEINDLYAMGARRGDGDLGARLEQTHRQAEQLGTIELALAAALVALHVFTLRDWRVVEEEEAVAPLPPGPRG